MTAAPECIWHDFGCEQPATRRDDGTWACAVHAHVHVSSFGSWVDAEVAG